MTTRRVLLSGLPERQDAQTLSEVRPRAPSLPPPILYLVIRGSREHPGLNTLHFLRYPHEYRVYDAHTDEDVGLRIPISEAPRLWHSLNTGERVVIDMVVLNEHGRVMYDAGGSELLKIPRTVRVLGYERVKGWRWSTGSEWVQWRVDYSPF